MIFVRIFASYSNLSRKSRGIHCRGNTLAWQERSRFRDGSDLLPLPGRQAAAAAETAVEQPDFLRSPVLSAPDKEDLFGGFHGEVFPLQIPPALLSRGNREAGPEQGLVCLGQRDAVAGGAVQAATSEEVLPHHESADDPVAAGSAGTRVGLHPVRDVGLVLAGAAETGSSGDEKGADSQSCPHLK